MKIIKFCIYIIMFLEPLKSYSQELFGFGQDCLKYNCALLDSVVFSSFEDSVVIKLMSSMPQNMIFFIKIDRRRKVHSIKLRDNKKLVLLTRKQIKQIRRKLNDFYLKLSICYEIHPDVAFNYDKSFENVSTELANYFNNNKHKLIIVPFPGYSFFIKRRGDPDENLKIIKDNVNKYLKDKL